MNYIQSADGTLALRLEASEAMLLSDILRSQDRTGSLYLNQEALELIAAIRNAAATLNHE